MQHDLTSRSVEDRCAIAERLDGMFDPGTPRADLKAAEDVAWRLTNDAVVTVRAALAHSVRHNRFLPKDLAYRIARDVEDVAAPFLKVTDVFSSSELASLVAMVTEAGRMAMAQRARVDDALSRELAHYGGSETVCALIQNPGAVVGRTAMATVYDRFEDQPPVLNLLVKRHDLPLDFVERLVARVSRAAADKLISVYDMPDYTEPAVAEASAAALLLSIARAPEATLLRFVQQMKQRDELGPELILRALDAGYLSFFEAAMSARSALALENVRRLIREGGPSAMAQLSHAAETPYFLRERYQIAVNRAIDRTGESTGMRLENGASVWRRPGARSAQHELETGCEPPASKRPY